MTTDANNDDQDARAAREAGTGDDHQAEPPWWGVDSETGQGYFGPMPESDAVVAREAHERRDFIELVRQAPVWEGTA